MELPINVNYTQKQVLVNGHNLFCTYYLNGCPTVIFEAGLGDDSEVWRNIQNNVSCLTSTLSYDRAGIGKSEVGFTPRSAEDIVKDLFHLLTKLSLNPPFILVGHSFGGLVMRLFASTYPNLIAGMILVDAVPENKEEHFEKVLPDHLKIRNREYLENPELNPEKIDKVVSYKQILNRKRIFDFPMTIITRGQPDIARGDWPNEEILKIEQELQSEFLQLSRNSKRIIATKSGHYIQEDEPELVIDAIRELI